MIKRSKMVRYNPTRAKALRDKIAKHPNPMFGQMLADGRMSDGDLLDLAVNVADAYFSGALLEPVAAAAARSADLRVRRTLLVTAAKFGCTATFTEDGSADLKSAWSDDDPATHIAAVQALVDTGMSIQEAMDEFSPVPPKQTPMPEPARAQLPAISEIEQRLNTYFSKIA